MFVPKWLIVVLLVAIAALVLILWSIKRRSPVRLQLGPIGDLGDLMRSVAGVTQGTLVAGNAIELLHNGRFFDVLFPELEQARKSIHLETFLCKEGTVTRRLAAILAARAKAGVEVRLMLDGSGGKNFGRDDIRRMKEAGCQVQFYHPIHIWNLGRLNTRTHRKIVVIDGRVGYIGGHCMVDTWLGDAEDKQHFRDITARVQGPVVAQVQSAFSDNWIEQCGEVITGEHVFPELQPAGEAAGHVVFISPTGTPSTLKLLHNLAIRSARKRIRIQNPYFLPDPDARDALVAAVQRGVDVRVMIPATEASDSPWVQHASHHHYGTLLKGGVRIFDYQRTLLHQKVFVVDGEWSSIGSTNFDDRSFEINDEVSLVTYDAALAAELERVFEDDLRLAKERTLDEWQSRSAAHKLIDFATFLFNEQL